MRAKEPKSLAESITLGHGTCVLPWTHDRLEECHHWWHEMARNYHEPDSFRWSLGAFISAARSVTFMLQSERRLFEDFSWYEQWQSEASREALLLWLRNTRTMLTHQQGLSTKGWMRFRCILEQDGSHDVADGEYLDEDDQPLHVTLNPFLCTHYYIRSGPVEEHGHEYQRHWEADDLPGQELLEVCATLYDSLAEVVERAHLHLGAGMGTRHLVDGELITPEVPSRHLLGCMDDTAPVRTITTHVKDGAEVWDDPAPHTA